MSHFVLDPGDCIPENLIHVGTDDVKLLKSSDRNEWNFITEPGRVIEIHILDFWVCSGKWESLSRTQVVVYKFPLHFRQRPSITLSTSLTVGDLASAQGRQTLENSSRFLCFNQTSIWQLWHYKTSIT